MKILNDQIGKSSKKQIEVTLSYKIIELFSDGLYASPNKAVEELVSNSFDAGATLVHVLMSADRSPSNPQASIVVIDNGIGMNELDLNNHWKIGVSTKRQSQTQNVKSRKQIGKFGIGKLATYVLSERLTHITKKDDQYFLTSMDYSKVPQDNGQGVFSNGQLNLPLHILSEDEAKKIITPLITCKNRISLFGKKAEKTWTVVVMHNLKDSAQAIQTGKLKWILSTALPLRDDFKLFFNDEEILSSKLKEKPIHKWTLGKDYKKENIKKPALNSEYEDALESSKNETDLTKCGLNHDSLGFIRGYFEVYEDSLTQGKSDQIERSNGFFIYVHDRLINIDDSHFGIDANQLRHGTLSRFRAVLHIDGLDKELRSSRETVREGTLNTKAHDLLKAIFNHASAALTKHTENGEEGKISSSRIGSTPSTLTKIPILNALQSIAEGKYKPLYLDFKGDKLTQTNLQQLSEDIDKNLLVQNTALEEVSPTDVVAKYNIQTRVLTINSLHPFIAYFMDEVQDSQVPFELISMLEILTETYLLESGLDEDQIHKIMLKRDDALRHFSKSSGKKTASIVAQQLNDSATDKNKLEEMLVASFNMLGFDATPIGGNGKPDGIAIAHLPANNQGNQQKYSVSLEAKSKENPNAKVSSKTVSVSTIARHRKDYNCDHALVVGPDFPEGKDENSAVLKEIDEDCKLTGKTITLIKVVDLARLIKLAPFKGIGIDQIRNLFETCASPSQSCAWIDKIEVSDAKEKPYSEILEAIWEIQKKRPYENVEYGSISTHIEHTKKITIPKADIRDICKYLSQIATGLIYAWETSVELRQKPEHIIDRCKKEISSSMPKNKSNIFNLSPEEPPSDLSGK